MIVDTKISLFSYGKRLTNINLTTKSSCITCYIGKRWFLFLIAFGLLHSSRKKGFTYSFIRWGVEMRATPTNQPLYFVLLLSISLKQWTVSSEKRVDDDDRCGGWVRVISRYFRSRFRHRPEGPVFQHTQLVNCR